MITRYLFITALFVLFIGALLSFATARQDATTFDEIAHVGSGYSYLLHNDFRLNPEHPPILKVLSAIPLLFIEPPFAIEEQSFWTTHNDFGEYGQWDAGRFLLHSDANADDSIIFWTRVPLVLLAIAFGFFIFHWGMQLGRGNAHHPQAREIAAATGLIALLLWTFDPNILAHNHLVTTDIGAAAALSASLYFFIHFLKKPTWKNTVLAGVFFGLANLVKFSAIILGPFFVLMTIIYIALNYKKNSDHTAWKLFSKYASRASIMALTTIVVIFLVYIPFSYATPSEVLQNITPLKILENGRNANIWAKNAILTVNEVESLRPLALYIHGVAQVFHRVAGGNQTYFIGTVSSDADPLYFPTVFALKEPLLYLFLYAFVIGSGFLMFTRALGTWRHVGTKQSFSIFRTFLAAHFTELTLIIFIAFYACLAIFGNLTIGFRHLFPIMPPLFLLTAKALTSAYKHTRIPQFKKALIYGGIVYGVSIVLLAIHAFPTYISFFNSLAGGTSHGWKYVVDSNYDWGQDSKRLKQFITRNEIEKMHVDYFGGDDISRRLGDSMVSWWDSKRPVEPGYYAISATLLQDSNFGNKPDDQTYRWTWEHTPLTTIGGMIIYKIE